MNRYEKRLIELIEERNEFVTDVDGYLYWWPEGFNGHLSSYQLRAIADELDRINEPWNKQIDEYFKDHK